MPASEPEQLSKTIETLYRSESGRVLATLVGLLGDLDLAEEAMHEAFAAALECLTYIRLAASRILDGILEDQSLPGVLAA